MEKEEEGRSKEEAEGKEIQGLKNRSSEEDLHVINSDKRTA